MDSEIVTLDDDEVAEIVSNWTEFLRKLEELTAAYSGERSS